MLPNDIRDAARLIEWGLHPRALPENNVEYRDLVRRWTDEGGFQAVVAAVSIGGRRVHDGTRGYCLILRM